MAYIRPIAYFLVGFLLAILTGIASASFQATPVYTVTAYEGYSGTGSTPAAACADHAANGWSVRQATSCGHNYWYPYGAVISQQDASNCRLNPVYRKDCTTNAAISNGTNYATINQTGYTCPANSTLSGTTCTCNATFQESGSTCLCPSGTELQGGTCVATCPAGQVKVGANCQDECPAAGPVTGVTGSWYELSTTTYNSALATVCLGGCTFKVTTSSNVPTEGGYMAAQIGNQTGAECTPIAGQGATQETIPEPELSPEGKCVEKGMSYGYVNDQVVCVAKADSPTATTSTVNSTDTSGNVTTTATTVNPDGTVSQTTTTKDSSGATTGTTTTNYTTVNDFCVTNKDLAICKTSSAGTGEGCTTPPSCTGDAIQCAILHQSWLTKCNMEDAEAESVANQALENTNQGILSIMPELDGGTFNLPTQLDQSAFIGTSACPPDQSITIPIVGQLTIPWSSLCPHLNMMGNGLVLASLLLGLRIMIKRD